MNKEMFRAVKRVSCGRLFLAAAICFFADAHAHGDTHILAQSPATQPAAPGAEWLLTALIGIVSLFLAIVAGALLQMMFFLIRDARDNLTEVRQTKETLQKELERASQLVGELRSLRDELPRERIFLNARRRAAYDLYSRWSQELAKDPKRATDLTRRLVEIGHLFESCAAPDDETQVKAIAGLGGELGGVFDAPVRYFFEALERGDYYTPRSPARTQLERFLGQGPADTGAVEVGQGKAPPDTGAADPGK